MSLTVFYIAEVFMRTRLNITQKTREHNLIVPSAKSDTAITNDKRLRSKYCTVDVNWSGSIALPLPEQNYL